MSDDKKRKHERPLYIDMPFGEALGRFIGVDPKELPEKLKDAKQPKKRATKAKPRDPKVVKAEKTDRKS